MKKISFFVAIAAAASLASCTAQGQVSWLLCRKKA